MIIRQFTPRPIGSTVDWERWLVNRVPARARASVLELVRPSTDRSWPWYLLVAAVAIALGQTVASASASGVGGSTPMMVVIVAIFAGMVLGDFRRLLLGAVLLELPFQMDKHFNYREEIAALGAIGGLGISTTTFALLALYGLWLVGSLSRVGSHPRPDLRASLGPGLYLAGVGASLFMARDLELAVFEVALLVQMFLIYLYVVSTVRTRKDVVFVVVMLVLGLVLQSLLMVGQRFGGDRFALPGRVVVAELGQGQYERVAGTIGGANAASAYLAFMLAPAAALMVAAVGPWVKRLAAFGFVLGAVALFLTLTRGGWIAFGLSMALFAYFACRRGWLHPLAPVMAVVLTVPLAFAFQDLITARLLAEDGGSAHSRFPLMHLALRIIEDYPLLGVGPNHFALVMTEYVTPDFSTYGGSWLYVVHNKYLLVWAETGLIGLIAFLGFLFTTLSYGWRGYQLGDRVLSPIALALTVAIGGHMMHMGADVFADRPLVETLWLSSAVLVAISRIPVRLDNRAPSSEVTAGGPWRVSVMTTAGLPIGARSA